MLEQKGVASGKALRRKQHGMSKEHKRGRAEGEVRGGSGCSLHWEPGSHRDRKGAQFEQKRDILLF